MNTAREGGGGNDGFPRRGQRCPREKRDKRLPDKCRQSLGELVGIRTKAIDSVSGSAGLQSESYFQFGTEPMGGLEDAAVVVVGLAGHIGAL